MNDWPELRRVASPARRGLDRLGPDGAVEEDPVYELENVSACNSKPKRGHPWHGTLVACHMAAGHLEPHSWDLDRQGQASSFVCPVCGAESGHPEDVRHGYCGACHDFTAPR